MFRSYEPGSEDKVVLVMNVYPFEEPSGGWDTFEGFTVPYPPPSPRTVAG